MLWIFTASCYNVGMLARFTFGENRAAGTDSLPECLHTFLHSSRE